jgi:O-antigen/teichoic acid export membrane protein
MWIGPRGRAVLHGSAWALLSRAAGAANLLLSVPVVLNAIGAAPFGVWATIVSLAVLGSSLDFGLGNGAMNLIASARGREANEEIRTILVAAAKPMVVAGLVIGGAVGAAGLLFPWAAFPQLAQIPPDELRASAVVLAFAIALAIPLSLATKALIGLGEAHLAFKWQAVGQILTLALTAGLASSGAGLVGLVSAALLGPLAGSLSQATTLVLRLPGGPTKPVQDLRPKIYRSGALFFGIQLCAMLAFGLDLLIITMLATPEQTASYATVQRVFQLVPMSLAMLWTPLWPAYRHAIEARDSLWTQRTLRKSVFGAIIFAICLSLLLSSLIGLAQHHAALPAVRVTPTLLGGFIVWVTLEALGTALATYLNAQEALRVQLVLGMLFAAASMMAKILAASTIGPDSIPWVTAACYVTMVLVPLLIWWPRYIWSR